MSNQKNDFYHNSAELPLIRGVRPTVELVNIMYEVCFMGDFSHILSFLQFS